VGLERFLILTIEGPGKVHYFRRTGIVSYFESVGKVLHPGGAIEKVPSLGRVRKKFITLVDLEKLLTLEGLPKVPNLGSDGKGF
jgi:hypothetical protein